MERNGIIAMARGNRLPTISRDLTYGSGSEAAAVTFAEGDTASFYFGALAGGSPVLDWVAATVTDMTNGGVSYAWDTSDTLVTPGLYEFYFRVNRVAGPTWTMPEPGYIQIWQPILSPGTWFAPLERVRSWLDARDHSRDDILAMCMDSVTSDLERELGFPLISSTRAHDGTTLPKLSGDGSCRLYIPESNLTAIAGLEIEDEGVLDVADRDVIRWESRGIILRMDGGVFPWGVQNVSATYTAGWTTYPNVTPTIPMDLMRVGLERVGKKWQEWTTKGPQDSAVILGGETVQLSDPDFTAEQRRILNRHRRIVF